MRFEKFYTKNAKRSTKRVERKTPNVEADKSLVVIIILHDSFIHSIVYEQIYQQVLSLSWEWRANVLRSVWNGVPTYYAWTRNYIKIER